MNYVTLDSAKSDTIRFQYFVRHLRSHSKNIPFSTLLYTSKVGIWIYMTCRFVISKKDLMNTS